MQFLYFERKYVKFTVMSVCARACVCVDECVHITVADSDEGVEVIFVINGLTNITSNILLPFLPCTTG